MSGPQTVVYWLMETPDQEKPHRICLESTGMKARMLSFSVIKPKIDGHFLQLLCW